MLLELVLLATTGLFLWVTIGYPFFLILVARLAGRPIRMSDELPTLAIVIPTYDAAPYIEPKLEELLLCDYPQEKLEIIVVDSASRDGTRIAAEKFSSSGVTVLSEPQRLGKGAALAAAARATEAQIILATDVDSSFAVDVPKKMARYFSDPAVGIVSASRILPAAAAAGPGGASGVYWRYDSFLKRYESRLYSAIGAIGEAMAFRRSILMASDSTKKMIEGGADDTVLSYETLRCGMRIVLAEDCEVCEGEYAEALPFLNHKRRIIHQNMLNIVQFWDVLRETHLWYSLFIVPSRRILPLVMPLCYIANIVASAMLAAEGDSFAKLVFSLHLLLFAFAAASCIPALSRVRAFQFCSMLLVFNAAIGAAAIDLLRQRRYSVWPILSSKEASS